MLDGGWGSKAMSCFFVVKKEFYKKMAQITVMMGIIIKIVSIYKVYIKIVFFTFYSLPDATKSTFCVEIHFHISELGTKHI